jgi:serine/threonine-protein kinase HipA
VGGDAIGDVRVVIGGRAPGEVPPLVRVSSFDEVRFADLLADIGLRPDRVGLPGVQDKVSAAMINLPVATATDRFILKLNPPEFPHLVENEAFFLDAARHSGLAVVAHRVVRDADGQVGLLVRRFDRVGVGGQVRSLAVEDGCQVLGRPPGDK